jgi:hypothetical protein
MMDSLSLCITMAFDTGQCCKERPTCQKAVSVVHLAATAALLGFGIA